MLTEKRVTTSGYARTDRCLRGKSHFQRQCRTTNCKRSQWHCCQLTTADGEESARITYGDRETWLREASHGAKCSLLLKCYGLIRNLFRKGPPISADFSDTCLSPAWPPAFSGFPVHCFPVHCFTSRSQALAQNADRHSNISTDETQGSYYAYILGSRV